MPATIQSDLAREYGAWLRERLTTVERGQTQVLSTPFLDPFHDGIQVHVEPHGGEMVLHDNGDTLEHLSCLGVKIEDSERRRALIQRAPGGCAVRVEGGRLETTATAANLPQRLHFLLVAVLQLDPVCCRMRFGSRQRQPAARAATLPERVHFLMTALLPLNNLWMSA